MVVEVRVPIEKATVFFNNQVTRTDGRPGSSLFSVASGLKPGSNIVYKYEIRAEWIIDGKKDQFDEEPVEAAEAGRARAGRRFHEVNP